MKIRLQEGWRSAFGPVVARVITLVVLAALAGTVAWLDQGAKAQDAVCARLTTRVFDTYDVEELRRLLELARESGFSEDQVRRITVEDAEGITINAFKVIQDIDRCRREAEERLAEEEQLAGM